MEEILRCSLEAAVGRRVTCPGAACSFWEDDAGGGHCVFEDVDLRGRADLAALLLSLREQLQSSSAEERAAGRRAFYERLNAGRSD